jgi:ElaB/YqjD/DUF883 family membrane-anchored ribosome-binding protein
MARDPNTPALAADYDALLAQLATMRTEMTHLANQVGTSAAQNGRAMADTVTAGMQDARRYAGRRAHDADAQIEHAVSANPYIALGLAAGLGILLGAMSRR